LTNEGHFARSTQRLRREIAHAGLGRDTGDSDCNGYVAPAKSSPRTGGWPLRRGSAKARRRLPGDDINFLLADPGRQGLNNNVLIVTGGSRGIGAATARLAAEQGYAVAVNFTADAAAAADVVREIDSAGGRAIAVRADVAREDDVLAMFAQVDRELGRLTALVNNAGVVDMPARVDELSVPRLRRMLDINVLGSFLCAREAVRRMSTRHGGAGGAIVNLSSAAVRLGSPGQYVHYAASKGAIDAFTLGLAKEVAGEGIRVNAVRPGIIDTDIHASGGQPDRARELAPQVPMQRPGTAMEVAQAIVWLLGDGASYTTGSILDVTGGR
jgi:NAD(P)-dependent dehydrogenase (short-subunit alcohol dehydrogenase family)